MIVERIYHHQSVYDFLSEFDLSIDNVEECYGIYDQNQLVACGCLDGDVIKGLAINPTYSALNLLEALITTLKNRAFEKGVSHTFIFSKKEYQAKFNAIGYDTLVIYGEYIMLESGYPKFKNQFNHLKDFDGCIVMNANPFTYGHYHLIKYASQQVNQLLVLVVETDLSFFPFKDRIELIKQGCHDLNNVTIIPSTKYVISKSTFPTYFIKDSSQLLDVYTNIDALMFVKIMDKLGIDKRFVGQEPLDPLTNHYNQVLKTVLSNHHKQLIEIQRISDDNNIISASLVRSLLNQKQFYQIKKLVPSTTYDYLIKHYG